MKIKVVDEVKYLSKLISKFILFSFLPRIIIFNVTTNENPQPSAIVGVITNR